MSLKITVRRAGDQDLSALWALVDKLGYGKDAGYFEYCLELQKEGKREIYILAKDGIDAGYGILNWQPKYAPARMLSSSPRRSQCRAAGSGRLPPAAPGTAGAGHCGRPF